MLQFSVLDVAVLLLVCYVVFQPLQFQLFSLHFLPASHIFHSKWLSRVITVDPLAIQLDGLHAEKVTDGDPTLEPVPTL